MLQQVVGVAVAVTADHHQSHEGRQEDGGQHADGHDHHRLHGDGGGRQGVEGEERWGTRHRQCGNGDSRSQRSRLGGSELG